MSDDIASFFKADSDIEKIEEFERSTAALILAQVGISAARAKQLKYEYGEAFTLPWVAESLGWNIELWATRCFSFNVADLLLNPRKSPIVKIYQDHIAETNAELPYYMVFKAYEIGRLVAMSVPPTDRPYICTFVGDPGMYITSFKNLFSDLFGSENEL